jgi:2-polyprenyl-3-methyl-5-hydroxy-6-metoxy-1,4-benzoquinol methylase
MMSDQVITELDDIAVAGSDTSAPLNMAKRLRQLDDRVPIFGRAVLDAGCGAGAFVDAMARMGANARGVEYSEDKVQEWQSRNPGDDRVRQGDLEDLAYPTDTFEVVLLNEVLEHVPDDNAALREIWRVLKPGGSLVMFSPNRLYPIETHGVIRRSDNLHLGGLRTPFLPWLPVSIGAKRYRYWARNYWPRELASMARSAGFTVTSHSFVWQTFENISGGKARAIHRVAPLARAVANIAERLPVVRRFGVSQLIVAVK